MIQEKDRNGNHHHDQKARARLQIVKHFAKAADFGAFVLTDQLRFMHRQRVFNAVVITFCLEDKISAAVIDLRDSVRVETALAVDHGPVGDNITDLQRRGVLHGHIENHIAGLKLRVHGVCLDRQHPQPEQARYAVSACGDIACVGTERRNDDRKHQNDIDDRVGNLSALALFWHQLLFLLDNGQLRLLVFLAHTFAPF